MRLISSALLTLLPLTTMAVSSLYDNDPNVKQLTTYNFKAIVETSVKPVLVEFYSPGCPHCTNLVPTWRNVAKTLAGHMPVVAVNCQDDSLCSKYRVQGVPTIKIFLKNEQGELYFVDYNGERTADAIIKFAEGYVTSLVVKVSDVKADGKIVTLDDFLKTKPKLPHILFFKTGSMVPSLGLKTLSVDYNNKFQFGIANGKIDGKLGDKLGVSLPQDSDAVVYIEAGRKDGELYDGKLRFTEMRAYLDKVLTLSPMGERKTEL